MLEPELECDAAKNQREEHDQNGEKDGGKDDPKGERKGHKQSKSPEHKPSLVPVPDWRDRIHNKPAVCFASHESVEYSNAEIETVEDDVIKDREGEKGSP